MSTVGHTALQGGTKAELGAEPTFRERVKELLIEKFGWRGCRHDYRVVQRRVGVSIRCYICGHETEMFQIARHEGLTEKVRARAAENSNGPSEEQPWPTFRVTEFRFVSSEKFQSTSLPAMRSRRSGCGSR